MILVVGATGTIGRDVVAKLTELGVPFRALSRNPTQAKTLPGFDKAEVVAGDAANASSLRAGFDGIEKILLVPPSGAEWNKGEANLIEAAKAAGVKYVVKVSTLGIDPKAAGTACTYHAQGEKKLMESGIPYTILRANSFMQNFLHHHAPNIRSNNCFVHCMGKAQMSMVDTRDIAEIAVRLLTYPEPNPCLGCTYPMLGREPLSHDDAARVLSAVLGREIRSLEVSTEDYKQALIGAGLSAFDATELASTSSSEFFRDGTAAVAVNIVQEFLGRPARTFEEFVRDHADRFQPAQ